MNIRKILFGLGVVLVATYWGAMATYASPRPSFTMQIVPPECTIDVIDDGLGPVQVVTCPPPDPIDEPDEGTEAPPTPGLEPGADMPSEVPPAQSVRRLYSPSDMVDLLAMFDTQGLKPNMPSGIMIPKRPVDIVMKRETNGSNFGMWAVAIPAGLTLAAGVALYVLVPGFRRVLLRLLRGKM